MPIAYNRSVSGLGIIPPVPVKTSYDGDLPLFEEANSTIVGISKDLNGSILGNCIVKLFNTATDVISQQTISDASGNYSFAVDKTQKWYVVAYKAGSPDVAGTTLNTLVGTIPGFVPPPATPYVQFKASNSLTDAASFSVTFNAAPTPGNLLILVASSGTTLTTPAGWVRDVNVVNDLQTSIYSKISNGTETTITISTIAGNATGQLVAIEWPSTYTTIDKIATGAGSASDHTFLNFGTTATTTAANEILIAAGGLNLASPTGSTKPSVSWSNSFTELSHEGAINGSGPPYSQMLGVAFRVVTSTGTFTTTWTFTNPGATVGTWNAALATYK